MKNNARKATTVIVQAIDDGLMDPSYILASLLNWLDESEVAEFYQDFLNEGHAEYMPAININ